MNIFAADNKAINYFGRWDAADTCAPRCGWGCNYIRLRFSGSYLAVLMEDAMDNWWQYSIDGAPFVKFQIRAEKNVLASDLTATEHELLLFRRTEGSMGESVFRGVELSSAGRLIENAFSQTRHLEFVGDSITAGFRNSGPDWADEDSFMAYSVQLARLLGADWSTIAISGIGVVHNYDEPWPPCAPHIQDYYPRVLKDDAQLMWDFGVRTPDAIIIAVGTNDFTDPNKKPDAALFSQGYVELVDVVRKSNPRSVIICTEPVPGWAGPLCGDWIAHIVARKNAAGDSHIHYISLNAPRALLLDEHYVGDGTHPNVAGGALLAGYLRDKIAQIVGWD